MASKHDRHWKSFPTHTRLKHGILRAYLGSWARILLQEGRHDTIWFVDGFAGRGQDEKANPGSPLIACSIAEEINTALAAKQTRGQLRVVAVEGDHENFQILEQSLARYRGGGNPPLLFENSIEDEYMNILRMIGGAPALFFLDPWGLGGLSSAMIENMLQGERREVLVLFSEESTHRLAGAVASDTDKEEPDPLEANLSLFDDPPSPSPPRPVSLNYRQADERILQDVFMGIWDIVADTAENAKGMERLSYLSSYMKIQELLGASYVLPISVVDERDHHHYSLIHASKHPKAVVAMKNALNSAMNKRAKEVGILENFRFASPGLERLCEQIEEHFVGQTVRWQDKRERGTVRLYALEETWALVSDLPDLKALLTARGHAIEQRPLTFHFPLQS